MRQNKNKSQTNCAWNDARTTIAAIDLPSVSLWKNIFEICTNENCDRKLNYPKRRQQQQQWHGRRLPQWKQNNKSENKSWKCAPESNMLTRPVKQKPRKKKKNTYNKRQQSQMKIIRPIGQFQLHLLCLRPLCLPLLHTQPQPQSVACCHISHATLCPLMSMPDICHGPCTTYIIHPRLRHGRRHALLLFLYRGKDLWTNILENRETERK